MKQPWILLPKMVTSHRYALHNEIEYVDTQTRVNDGKGYQCQRCGAKGSLEWIINNKASNPSHELFHFTSCTHNNTLGSGVLDRGMFLPKSQCKIRIKVMKI